MAAAAKVAAARGPDQVEVAGGSDIRKPDHPSVERAPSVRQVTPKSVLGGVWSDLGPKPVTDFSNQVDNGVSGRVTALAVAANSEGLIAYAGTVGGGVWKTTDGGASWAPKSDFAPSLAIGALAIDQDGQVIYAGTGEDNRSTSQYGQGILKSTDGGTTWTLLGQATFAGRHIGGLAFDRNTFGATQRVLAATDAGLYISSDGGATWTLNVDFQANAVPTGAPGTGSGAAYDIIQDPTTATTWWASLGDLCDTEAGNIAQSTDNGATWTSILTFSPAVSRPALGVGPDGVAYVAPATCPDTGSTLKDGQILKTIDGGSTWNPLSTPALAYLGPGYYLGQQGYYDNVVAVDPTNADHAVFGGVTLLATSNGGASFTDVGTVYLFGGALHPDFHAAAFTGTLDSLYVGNDGGVWRSSNLGGTGTTVDWTNLNATLETLEFYHGSSDVVATSTDSRLVGGTQDNGSPGNFGVAVANPLLPIWFPYLGGDGGFTAIDPNEGNATAYVESQYLGMSRVDVFLLFYSNASPCDSLDSFSRCVRGGIPDRTPFIAPFVMDPTDAQVLLAGTYRVYKTTNGGVPNGVASWDSLNGGVDMTLGGNDTLAVMTAKHATTAGNPLVVFTGSQFGAVWRSIDGGTTWSNITGNLPAATTASYVFPNPFVSGIAFNPGNPDEVWVSNGGVNVSHIWHTLNADAGAGTVWTAIDGSGIDSIPNAPAFSIIVDPADANRLFVGTYYGARACTTCGGVSPSPLWATLGTGLPHTAVGWLSLTTDDNTIVAWTKGRSTWSIPKPTGQPLAVAIVSSSARWAAGAELVTWRTGSESRIAGFNLFRNGVKLNGKLIAAKRSGHAAGASYRFVDRTAKRGRVYTYRLQVLDLNGVRSWYQIGTAASVG